MYEILMKYLGRQFKKCIAINFKRPMGIQALIYFFCTQNLELIVWDFISQLGFTASKNKTRKAPSPGLPE